MSLSWQARVWLVEHSKHCCLGHGQVLSWLGHALHLTFTKKRWHDLIPFSLKRTGERSLEKERKVSWDKLLLPLVHRTLFVSLKEETNYEIIQRKRPRNCTYMPSEENVVIKAAVKVFLQSTPDCKKVYLMWFRRRITPLSSLWSPSAPTAPLVFLMNSLLDILFLTWGELRSTERRIKEKHITYLLMYESEFHVRIWS